MAAAEGAPESTVGLTVNDASLDIVMSYDTVSEITVPEEAVASAQSIDLAAEAEMTAELAESEAADLAAEVAETEAVTEAVTE